ncbi:MAG: TetR/AcrR family transcriptional regulator [Pseudomonadota bacterium]|nr:TetR/AcrR family transcriptional regulator [Pseudomonadota bacterium]
MVNSRYRFRFCSSTLSTFTNGLGSTVPSRSQRRKKIIEAAGNAFLANGYSDFTMQDVAREAQISRAALYTYFGSRLKVFSNVIEFFLSVIVRSFIDTLERVGEDASIYNKLFAILEARQRMRLSLGSSQKSTFSYKLVKNHHKIIEEKGALPIQRVVKEVISRAYATGELPTFKHTPPPDSVADTIFLFTTAILFSDASEKWKSENLATLLSVFSKGLNT